MIENKKILLVEDDPDQILIYQSKFELEGFFLIVADNIRRTMDFALNDKPDLILLDLLLKDENGLDILAKLKQNSKTKKIPVIVFTNFDTEKSQDKAIELGAIDYIVKAKVTPSEIVKKVRRIIEQNNEDV
ncbi:MAG: response regulator [Patescibacteria group bacterium]